MPSADDDSHRRVVAHVQRTADPAVFRWVVHHPRVSDVRRSCVAPVGSALAELVAEGLVTRLDVVDGGVEVAVAGGDVAAAVSAVDRAVRIDLEGSPAWLCGPSHTAGVDLGVLQRAVDVAAGPLTTLHGGTVEVVAVDGGVVMVRMEGTCAGCSFTARTLDRLVLPAVRRACPEVRAVRLASERG